MASVQVLICSDAAAPTMVTPRISPLGVGHHLDVAAGLALGLGAVVVEVRPAQRPHPRRGPRGRGHRSGPTWASSGSVKVTRGISSTAASPAARTGYAGSASAAWCSAEWVECGRPVTSPIA